MVTRRAKVMHKMADGCDHFIAGHRENMRPEPKCRITIGASLLRPEQSSRTK